MFIVFWSFCENIKRIGHPLKSLLTAVQGEIFCFCGRDPRFKAQTSNVKCSLLFLVLPLTLPYLSLFVTILWDLGPSLTKIPASSPKELFGYLKVAIESIHSLKVNFGSPFSCFKVGKHWKCLKVDFQRHKPSSPPSHPKFERGRGIINWPFSMFYQPILDLNFTESAILSMIGLHSSPSSSTKGLTESVLFLLPSSFVCQGNSTKILTFSQDLYLVTGSWPIYESCKKESANKSLLFYQNSQWSHKRANHKKKLIFNSKTRLSLWNKDLSQRKWTSTI